jgi:hypothetical protein
MPIISSLNNLLAHLYQFFSTLLGCSKIGTPDFPTYVGDKSMYEVHRYMALDAFQVGYFITQVGLSVASSGVAQADMEAVGMSLNNLFGYKCARPATVVPSQGSQLQAVCIEVQRCLDCVVFRRFADGFRTNSNGSKWELFYIRKGDEAVCQCIDDRQYQGSGERHHERDHDLCLVNRRRLAWQACPSTMAYERHRYGGTDSGSLRAGCSVCVVGGFTTGCRVGRAFPCPEEPFPLAKSHFSP